ncbi:MAG: tetratricopeptide repeat protein [Planctomycetota bacterium]
MDSIQLNHESVILRMAPDHGESIEMLHQLGLNTMWEQDFGATERARELYDSGFAVLVTPPHPEFEPGDFSKVKQALPPLDQQCPSASGWYFGTRVSREKLTHLLAWSRAVRSGDRIFQRPQLADLTEAEGAAAREIDLIGIGRHVIGRSESFGELRNLLFRRRRSGGQLAFPSPRVYEVPADLMLFVCNRHIVAGGDENHNRVEDLLRGWLVKYGDVKEFDTTIAAEVQLLLAKNFFQAKRFDAARSEYETAMNRYPETPQAIEAEFGIGESYMAQKVYDQAELVFENLAHNRNSEIVVRAEFLRGVLAHRRGDPDEARKIFRAVLDKVPNVELANQALYQLSEVYRQEERDMDQLNLLNTVGRLGRSSKRTHRPGMPLSIVVQDSDLGISRGQGKVPVIVSTEPGGDREIVYLTSGGAGRGLFRTDLDTRLGAVTQEDHVLQLTGLDIIRCDYPDEFKKEFRKVPFSDVEIQMASDGKFEMANSRIHDEKKESFSDQLQKEVRETPESSQRLGSQTRPASQVKPGNQIYLRVDDPDRDHSDDPDQIVIKLDAESGDGLQVRLQETGPHTGVYEGTAATGELPAGALASDTSIQHSPLMAIDGDPGTFWMSEPDGATPKFLTVDMKDLKTVNRLRISSPRADQHIPIRGDIMGSNDGQFWFRIATHPQPAPTPAVTDEFGHMKRRVFEGDYTGYSNWQQIVNLSRNSQTVEDEDVTDLLWSRPTDAEDSQKPYTVIWHRRSGALFLRVLKAYYFWSALFAKWSGIRFCS